MTDKDDEQRKEELKKERARVKRELEWLKKERRKERQKEYRCE